MVLGRGLHLATALEWALKLKELAYVRAQGYSTADFQHGPAASLAPGGHLLAVSAGGPLQDELPEWLSPLSAIVPIQLFCCHLAVAKGLDFEAPRGLNKVTLTQ